MGNIKFVAGAIADESVSQTNHTIVVPAGVKVGDLIVVLLARSSGSNGMPAASGWNQVGPITNGQPGAQACVHWRIASTSEVAGSTLTFTTTAATNAVKLLLMAFRGVDSVNPLIGSRTSGQSTLTSTHAVDASGLVPDHEAVVCFLSEGFGGSGSPYTISPPSGFIEAAESPGGFGSIDSEGAYNIVGAGAVGTVSATSSVAMRDLNFVLAFNAARNPVVQGSSYWDSGATVTSWTVTTPAGVQVGELLVACIMAANFNLGTITPPAGWTAGPSGTSGDTKLHTFWKKAGASEPASYTFTTQNSSEGSTGCVRITGAADAPLDAGGGAYIAAASGGANPLTIPAMTAADINRLYLAFCGSWFDTSDGAQWSAQASMTKVFEGVGGDTPQGAFYEAIPVSGSTGSRDLTKNAILRARAAIGLLIAPPSGPTIPTTGQLHPRGWKNTLAPASGQLLPRSV